MILGGLFSGVIFYFLLHIHAIYYVYNFFAKNLGIQLNTNTCGARPLHKQIMSF
jgi:hypothetical protein